MSNVESFFARLHGIHDIRVETGVAAQPGDGEVRLRMARGGICGSDLHYYDHGGVGTIRVREPIILGHEASGYVEAAGRGVDLAVGTLVAINPSQPCGRCDRCAAGLPRHCRNMRFRGSAMYMPHEQGLYRSRLTVPASQCVAFPEGADPGAAACTEPLAVCLHALSRVPGDLGGKRVLVTGAGPIGLLTAAAAKAKGAGFVAITDVQEKPLAIATKMGVDQTFCVGTDANWRASLGEMDVAFECSAAASAIEDAVEALKPCGTLVEVGVAGTTPLPLGRLVAKEITMIGTHRFDQEFQEAARMIADQTIDVAPMITGAWPLSQIQEALDAALDRAQNSKVQINLQEIN